MLTGQNGILNRASEAKEKTEVAQTDEKEILTYSPSGTYNWQAKYCSTTQTDDVTLSSANGEDFNLTELLNDACSSLYSSDGISARSLNIEDIEKYMDQAKLS